MGDTLVALPALWELRRAYPDAQLTLLTNSDTRNSNYLSPRSVLEGTGIFDHFLDYPTNLGRIPSFIARLKLLMAIRSIQADVVYYLMPRARTNGQIDRDIRFFSLAGISEVKCVNYFRKNSISGKIPSPTPRIVSESEFLIDCLESEGVTVDRDKLSTELGLSESEQRAGELWLKVNDISPGTTLIAIGPGSKWESKLWFENRFALVVDRLIREGNVTPIVFGGSEDRERGDRLIKHWGRGGNSAGSLSVRESAALLSKCVMYLGNDTGTMHLAAAVRLPCVAIFAAIDYLGRWEPFGNSNRIFRKRVECEGCHTPDCFNGHKCLDLISIDEVVLACREILSLE